MSEMKEVLCEECGEPMADGGPCGWYCTSDKPHPLHDERVRKLIYNSSTVPRLDYDALLSEKAAHAAENERLREELTQRIGKAVPMTEWEKLVADRDRLRDEVRHLRSAIAGAREAIEDGYIHLEQDADDAENSSMLTRLRQKTVAKWRASAEQLRALASIGDLPAGEEG